MRTLRRAVQTRHYDFPLVSEYGNGLIHTTVKIGKLNHPDQHVEQEGGASA